MVGSINPARTRPSLQRVQVLAIAQVPRQLSPHVEGTSGMLSPGTLIGFESLARVLQVANGSGSGSWASSPATRKSMQGNRSRDTKPELAVRSAVHRRGIRFRVAARPQPELPRTADLVLRKSRIAVFVDGCFWHGCPRHHTQPTTNSEYWADKIASNIERDAETTAYLQQSGWTVLRFWEHEDPEAVADLVQESVRSALEQDTDRGIASG